MSAVELADSSHFIGVSDAVDSLLSALKSIQTVKRLIFDSLSRFDCRNYRRAELFSYMLIEVQLSLFFFDSVTWHTDFVHKESCRSQEVLELVKFVQLQCFIYIGE